MIIEPLQWVLGAAMLGLFVLLAGTNFRIMVVLPRRLEAGQRGPSPVPIVGGLLGMMAVLTLPLPEGLANTDTPRFYYTPLTPAASACLGCHDSRDAAAHAYLQTASFGEACSTCHKEGADFAVSKAHAR